MANTLITKNSSTAAAIPTAGQLVQGELAVNVTDKRVFTENAAGAVVELGVNPSSVTTGALAYTGTLTGGTGVVNIGSGQVYKDASGNVGIGTNLPTQSLTVNGGVLLNTTNQISFSTTDYFIRASTGLEVAANDFTRFLIAGTERVRIDSSGNLLVGTTTAQPAAAPLPGNIVSVFSGSSKHGLNITTSTGGTSTLVHFGYSAYGTLGSITTNATTTSYNTSSDYRLKEDWVAVANASTRVNAIKPVNFAWKTDGSRVDGFLAHELAEVVPEAVTGEKDAVDAEGKSVYQVIDQSKLVPLLTAALQEALAKIESLEARLDAANI